VEAAELTRKLPPRCPVWAFRPPLGFSFDLQLLPSLEDAIGQRCVVDGGADMFFLLQALFGIRVLVGIIF
jgi:hypothetical protein